MRLCQSLYLFLWSGAIALTPLTSRAETSVTREDELRAGYLFNFAHFVHWPALAVKQPLAFCFLGGVGIQSALSSAISDKQVDDHPMLTRVINARDSIENCQILYVDSSASSPVAATILNSAVLVIGDRRDFIHQGGMIELFTESNRLRFNINLANVRRAGLTISSTLLQLASQVEETS